MSAINALTHVAVHALRTPAVRATVSNAGNAAAAAVGSAAAAVSPCLVPAAVILAPIAVTSLAVYCIFKFTR